MGALRLLITKNWMEKCKADNFQAEEFFEFYAAFIKCCKELRIVEQDGLLDDDGLIKESSFICELDGLNILGKNDKIFKLFNYNYHFIHIKSTMTFEKKDVYTTDRVTGYCDVTDFLPILKNEFELNYCCTALNQFMRYGGIVVVDDNVFVSGEGKSIRDAIIQITPNIIDK